MAKQHTISALAHLRVTRNDHAYPTWFDVCDAYDAGLKHALEARSSAKRVMAELQARKEKVSDTAGESRE